MSIENNRPGFNILTLNMGADGRDYQMLMGQARLSGEDSIKSLLTLHQKTVKDISEMDENIKLLGNTRQPLAAHQDIFQTMTKQINENVDAKQGAIERLAETEEKLFMCLLSGKPGDVCADNTYLTALIFEKGLDVLEAHSADRDFFPGFIGRNFTALSDVLQKQVADDLGAKSFKQHYPRLTHHLQTHYNTALPEPLRSKKSTKWNKISLTIKEFFTKQSVPSANSTEKPADSIKNQLQRVKDRLAEIFFHKLVSSPERPAVISLQEVLSLNEKSIDILAKADYQICRQGLSDEVIAIDTRSFEEIEVCPLLDRMSGENRTAVYAKNKQTGEEFLFFSLHIPGYELVLPKETGDKELDDAALKKYLAGVEVTLEGGAALHLVFLKKKILELKDKYPNAHVIVQGDFNTSPSYFGSSEICVVSKIFNAENC